MKFALIIITIPIFLIEMLYLNFWSLTASRVVNKVVYCLISVIQTPSVWTGVKWFQFYI